MRIGVDFGGTKIEAAALDAQGLIRARVRRPTPTAYDDRLEAVRDIVAEVEATDGPLSSARLPSVLSMERREVAAKILDPYVRPNERVTRQRLQVIDLLRDG